jgi:hypothetical protein
MIAIQPVHMQECVYRALYSKYSMEAWKTLLLLLCVCWNVFTESLPNNGLAFCYQGNIQ